MAGMLLKTHGLMLARAKASDRYGQCVHRRADGFLRIDGDRFTAEWSNIPPQAANQGTYIRSECRRSGSRWIGTSRILLPCPLPEGKTKMCPMILQFEVDFISSDRITGGGETLRDFDCGSCEVRKTGWGPFTWAPKSSDK